jgi:transketolase
VAGAVAPEGVKVHKLAVHEVPRSGKPDELVDAYGISAAKIVDRVRAL